MDEPPGDVVLVWVDDGYAVDIEFFKKVSFDYDGSATSYDLTTEDIARWNLWDYCNEDDFDDDGELILP
jgi:hypothetical protein